MGATAAVSGCLLGIPCRYDGSSCLLEAPPRFVQGMTLVPLCAEVMAGLPVPRPTTRFATGDGDAVLDGSGSLINEQGRDMTAQFLRGALRAAELSHMSGCRVALLKERSPSCGVRWVHGEGGLISGRGVLAAALARDGLLVGSEQWLPETTTT